jgi:hypothetical protein
VLGLSVLVCDICDLNSCVTKDNHLSGDDNMEVGCTAKDVVVGNIVDHLGPYNGIWISCY